jgi:hypothetical protein
MRQSLRPAPRRKVLDFENSPAASAAHGREANRGERRQRHAALGSRPLRLTHNLHVEDRPELIQFALDPLK